MQALFKTDPVLPACSTRPPEVFAAAPVWRLLVTRPRQEKRVIASLSRMGLEHLAPQYTHERIRRGRRYANVEWLFPRYVFVRVSFEHTPLNHLKFLAGVAGFVKCGQRLIEVPDSIVASLNALGGQASGADTLPAPLYAAGTPVLLNGGAYIDVPAVFLEADGDARSRILLTWLGREVPVSMENLYLASA